MPNDETIADEYGQQLRPDLPPLPARLVPLLRRRGFPVPWFVPWLDPATQRIVPPDFPGAYPEFRAADARKRVEAVNHHRCWVCGQRLGTYLAFGIGPMCAVNRISADPPMHAECAAWSAMACPFLVRPHMERRDHERFVEQTTTAGHAIARNPGVSLVWITKAYRLVRAPRSGPDDAGGEERDGFLFQIGDPRTVSIYAEGRAARADEVAASVRGGIGTLLDLAVADGPLDVLTLAQQLRDAHGVLGLAPGTVELPDDAVERASSALVAQHVAQHGEGALRPAASSSSRVGRTSLAAAAAALLAGGAAAKGGPRG